MFLFSLESPTFDVLPNPPPTAAELEWWRGVRVGRLAERIAAHVSLLASVAAAAKMGMNLANHHPLLYAGHARSPAGFAVLVLGVSVVAGTALALHGLSGRRNQAVLERRFLHGLALASHDDD